MNNQLTIAPIETEEVGLGKIKPWLMEGIETSLKHARSCIGSVNVHQISKYSIIRKKNISDRVIREAKIGQYNTIVKEAGADT